MRHIFLSYCAEDRERVRPLVTLLSEVAPVWWDQSIHHGENWEIAVETAVEQAACVVVAWTRESVKSNWVRSEAGDARDRSILVPVLLDDVKPPLAFRHIQTSQLQRWDGDSDHPQAQALKEAVAALVARAAAAPPPASSSSADVSPTVTPPAAQPPRRRGGWFATSGGRMALGAIGAVVLLALLLGGYLLFGPSTDNGTSAVVTPSPMASPTSSLADASPTPTATATPSPAEDRVVRLSVDDTLTAEMPDMKGSEFDYVVSRKGRAWVRLPSVRKRSTLSIGLVHIPTAVAESRHLAYEDYTQEQVATLVALLTTLAYEHGVEVRDMLFSKENDAGHLRKEKNVGSQVAELLREWRTTHVRPAKADVRILTPDR